MKNWEGIRQHLIDNYKEEFITFLRGKPFTFESLVDLFNKVCDIQEVEEVLNYLIEEQKQTLIRSNLTAKLETYIKQLFLIVDGSAFEGTLAPCLKVIFRKVNLSNRDKNRFFAKDANQRPTEASETFKNLMNGFGQDVKRSYDIRNANAHGHELPKRTTTNDIYSLINTYLYFTALYYSELTARLEEQKHNELNLTPYLNKTIEQFKKKISRFVHLETQEDFNISEAYVVEYDIEDLKSEEDELRQERRGTVDHLRKNMIPEKRMMLWGDAGMGKSTTMDYFLTFFFLSVFI